MQRQTFMRHRKTPYAVALGVVFTLLAVIGLVAVVVYTLNLTKGMMDNTKQRGAFEKDLLPVVMFDPVPFEQPTDVEPLALLQSSLWATLLGEKRGSFQYDEMRLLIVPASDVDVAAAKLFGPDVKLEHQSFGDYAINYIYDETLNAYHVPLTGEVGYYTPRVDKIVRKGDSFVLTVAYIPPSNVWTIGQGQTRDEMAADKVMLYEMKRNSGNYYLTAIRDVEGATLVPGVPDAVLPNQSDLMPISPNIPQESQPQESGSDESSSSEGEQSSGASSSSSGK